MHELSLMQQVIDEITRQLALRGAPARRIREVRLRVGALDIHSEPAFRQAFEVLTHESPLAGAALALAIEPARLECPACGHASPIGAGEADPHDPSPYGVCPLCGALGPVRGGRGVLAIELLADEAPPQDPLGESR
jgi:hydrogenase nickel incorporation protein HypA/HybF